MSALRLLSPVLRPLSAVLCLLSAVLLFGPGCAHYQLGTDAAGKLTFQTLYLEPVENKTLLPQARALLSTQLREAFARDGRVTLVNAPEAADATLAVTITSYRRDVQTVREGDTGLARKFNLTLARPPRSAIAGPTRPCSKIARSPCSAKPSPTAASSRASTRRSRSSPNLSPPRSPTPPSTCGEPPRLP